jgi:hypothetical protein
MHSNDRRRIVGAWSLPDEYASKRETGSPIWFIRLGKGFAGKGWLARAWQGQAIPAGREQQLGLVLD